MNDELNPRDGGENTGGENTGGENTGSGNNGSGEGGNRPNLGTAPSGPKHPGNGGGKDQYSLGHGEENTDTPPTDEDEEDGE